MRIFSVWACVCGWFASRLFAWHGIQLARRPAWGRGYWLSIFMVDLESDYICVRSIALMDFKRLDPINNGAAPEATLPPVSR